MEVHIKQDLTQILNEVRFNQSQIITPPIGDGSGSGNKYQALFPIMNNAELLILEEELATRSNAVQFVSSYNSVL